MPAFYDEYYQAFQNLIGSADAQETYYGRSAASVDDWVDIFESTGIDFTSHAQQIDAFENFLIAFYPQEGLSKDDWQDIREEFYDEYGITHHLVDWQSWREAMGY